MIRVVRRGSDGGFVACVAGMWSSRDSCARRSAMQGYIFQINCSRGGVPKLPVTEALLTPTGLDCDRQQKRWMHGGPERALCLYALERIRELQAEGHPIAPGSTGENVTVAGLDWKMIEPGVRLTLGDEVVIEISSYTKPCKTIKDSFVGGDFKRISQKIHPGESRLYARVLRTGRLSVGQPVRVIGEVETSDTEAEPRLADGNIDESR